MSIDGPVEPTPLPALVAFAGRRESIESKTFAWSVDGLAEAMAWAKDIATRVRREDFCSRRRIDGFRQILTTEEDLRRVPKVIFPCKRLRAHPLPYCADWSLEVALGESPAKRVRH